MDNQKDNKIQQADQSKTSSISKKTLDLIDFFGNNQTFVFLYKKTEKLATALYMITNLFSDNEPMKWSTRKKISDVLSFMLTYKNLSINSKENFSENLRIMVLEIVSLLEIASRSGLVSNMNFSILKQEFSNLLIALEENKDREFSGGKQTIPDNFFNDQTFLKEKSQGQNTFVQSHTPKDNIIISDKSVFKSNNRQSVIIQTLKKKKELSIKDLTSVVHNCSEKTIQRELTSLVFQGIVKKIGQRRWSRYSLNINQ